MMKKLTSILLAAVLLISCAVSFAEGPAMSDVPGMTAPGVYPLVTDQVTLTLAITPSANVIDYDTNQLTLWLEEKLGINIEFYYLPASEATTKVDLMVASNEKLPDIIIGGVDSANVQYYGESGIIIPLNDYLDEYGYFYNDALDRFFTETEKDLNRQLYTSAVAGNIYCFPYMAVHDGNWREHGLYINQNWLDVLNLEYPTTLDELYDVLVAFRDQDPNGNGLQDELPLIGYASYDRRGDVVGDLLNAFLFYPYGLWPHARLIVNDGVVSSAVTAEEYREGLRFIHKLYVEGLLSPLCLTQNYSQLKAIIDRPVTEPTIAGVIATHPGSGAMGWSANDDGQSKIFEYVALKPVTGPEGICYAPQYPLGMAASTICITKDCENPEVAFRFLDAVCDYDVYMHMRYGIEGYDWAYAEEGELDVNGNQAVYKLATDHESPWAAQSQNIIWRLGAGLGLTSSHTMTEVASTYANPITQHMVEMFYDAVQAHFGKQPEETFYLQIFTAEEQEIADKYVTAIYNYSNESRDLFVNGELSLDTDWDEYIATLENLGLSEYLAVAQSCYDRMNNK